MKWYSTKVELRNWTTEEINTLSQINPEWIITSQQQKRDND